MGRAHEAAWDGEAERALARRMRALVALLAVSATLLLVGLVWLVQQSGDERDRALARTEHSYAVVLLIEQTRGAISRAESSLGRFVVDGDPRTGQLYADSWREAGADLDRLARLVGDNRDQVRLVARFQALYLKRGEELAPVATRASYKQGWAALSFFYKAAKSPTLPALRSTVQEIRRTEDAILDRRTSAAALRLDRSNGLTQILSIAGVLLALSVLTLAWLVSQAFAERRLARDAADQEADRAALLEQAVAARTAELSEANARLVEEAETRAAAEAKLRQVQKMEAVGQLTGGIAHDFNNMLAVVMGGLEMARRRLNEQTADTTRYLDQAYEGAERAAALTRRLLTFSRAEPLLPTAVAPDRLLHGMADLLDRTIGEGITVNIVAPPGLWPVWVDAYQLENAVLNLAVNARDAMNGVGTLTMRADPVTLVAEEVGLLPAGDYIRITVADTGSGMTQEVLERAFEPFFTTKPVGQGTGLGLSQILGFARQSDGDIMVHSAPGEGTRFSLILPRHRGVPLATEAPVERPTEAATAPGEVLLVEDDPRVRAGMEAALAELGCPAESFASAAEALVRLKAPGEVTLLITDVVMPDMNGVELVRRARTIRPDLPVLFVTGYVGDSGDATAFGSAPVLRKPFTLAALSKALAAALPERMAAVA
jgi:signal transduction histidine kinase/CheY-like chemotaxis protein